ncbi:hypothetical protein ACFLRB_06840, partial [Acidobacteriota bacterium]
NSPDIVTNSWTPWKLLPETTITVSNLSTNTDAANTLVNVFTSSFGIGMKRIPLSTKIVNIGRGEKIEVKFPFSKEILDGDQSIGTHVVINHTYDKNPNNNQGSQMIDGIVTSESGRDIEVEFPVLNRSGSMRQITLTILAHDFQNAFVSPNVHQFGPWEQITATLRFRVPNTFYDDKKHITVIGLGSGGELIDGLSYVVRIDD